MKGYRISEATVEAASLRWLNSIEGAYFVKRPASAKRYGHPDVTGCYRGRRVEIEMKAPGNEPTTLQARKLRDWAAAGAVAACSHSLAETQAIFCGAFGDDIKFKQRRKR